MLKLLGLVALVGALVWLLRRGRERPTRAAVGYDDGSSVTLTEGSVEHDRLAAAARRALAT